jgi:hypothetical protein
MATKRYLNLHASVKGVLERNLDAVDRAYRRAFNEARAELRAVIHEWESDLDFAMLPTRRRDVFIYEVKAIGPDVQIFRYVDEGTRPHIIRPKKPGGRLAFQPGYSARTAPIAQFNVGTGKKSGDKIYRMEVHHPGSKARKFTRTILDKAIAKIPQYTREEMQRN